MKHITDRVRERIRPLIVLLGPYFMVDFTLGGEPWSHGNLEHFHEYNAAIRKVAGDTDCLFVDLLDAYDAAHWLVHHDGCHANNLGHRIIANRIVEVLGASFMTLIELAGTAHGEYDRLVVAAARIAC